MNKESSSSPTVAPQSKPGMMVDFSTLLEGDLYEGELSALPDLFHPDSSFSQLNNTHGSYVQATATAVYDSNFDPDDAFSFLEGFHKSIDATPNKDIGIVSSSLKDEIQDFQRNHEGTGTVSPTSDQSQMEMELSEQCSIVPKKFSDATKAMMQTTLPDFIPKDLPTPQLGEVLGKKGNNSTAPVALKRKQKNKLAPKHKPALPELTPIAPRGSSSQLVPLAPAPTGTVPNPVNAPVPSPAIWSSGPAADAAAAAAQQPVLLPATAPTAATAGKTVTVAKAGVPTISKPTAKQRRYRRKDPSMTDEQAEQEHRERNKEHAKNTRLRKKAYIEALKENLNRLVEERDEQLRKESIEAETQRQHRQVRFQVIQTFLRLRGGDLDRQDPNLWSAVLQEDATFTRPCAPHGHATIATPSTIMADPGEPEMLKELMGIRDVSASIRLHYECDQESFMMDGCTCNLEWKGVVVGAEELGLPSGLSLKGSVRATFNEETNKMTAATLYFDTGPLRYQLSCSLGFP